MHAVPISLSLISVLVSILPKVKSGIVFQLFWKKCHFIFTCVVAIVPKSENSKVLDMCRCLGIIS